MLKTGKNAENLTVSVGHDSRISAMRIKDAVISEISQMGVNVGFFPVRRLAFQMHIGLIQQAEEAHQRIAADDHGLWHAPGCGNAVGVCRDEAVQRETEDILGRVYGGEKLLMIKCAVEADDLSDEEREELIALLKGGK